MCTGFPKTHERVFSQMKYTNFFPHNLRIFQLKFMIYIYNFFPFIDVAPFTLSVDSFLVWVREIELLKHTARETNEW